MNIQAARMLPVALVLMMAPALSWAANFDCAVYDMTINSGQGAEARQADDSIEASDVDEAVAQMRKREDWKDADKYIVKCRPVEE